MASLGNLAQDSAHLLRMHPVFSLDMGMASGSHTLPPPALAPCSAERSSAERSSAHLCLCRHCAGPLSAAVPADRTAPALCAPPYVAPLFLLLCQRTAPPPLCSALAVRASPCGPLLFADRRRKAASACCRRAMALWRLTFYTCAPFLHVCPTFACAPTPCNTHLTPCTYRSNTTHPKRGPSAPF